jgi:hypothetical protein
MIRSGLIAVLVLSIAAPALAAEAQRSGTLNFDEQVIEGVNKRAFDSYSQVSEKGKKGRKVRLYRLRDNFNDSTRLILRETEAAP